MQLEPKYLLAYPLDDARPRRNREPPERVIWLCAQDARELLRGGGVSVRVETDRPDIDCALCAARRKAGNA